MTQMISSLSFGGETITFHLIRRERKTLQISVLPDMSIEVIAPATATDDAVLAKLRKRAGWIKKQLQFFSQFCPVTPERRYVAGETHLYLGRRYRLKVILAIQEAVKLRRGFIEIHTHHPTRSEETQRILDEWYKARAQEKFKARIEACLDRFSVKERERYRPRAIIIRQIKQRWGSMTRAGRLVLNRSLIFAATHEIDYVITHELCHIAHHDHSPKFFELLTRLMPDWEKRKLSLERRLA